MVHFDKLESIAVAIQIYDEGRLREGKVGYLIVMLFMVLLSGRRGLQFILCNRFLGKLFSGRIHEAGRFCFHSRTFYRKINSDKALLQAVLYLSYV